VKNVDLKIDVIQKTSNLSL